MGKDCPICNEEYDEKERCPRSLPCSHTLCSECIENLISRNSKTCPFCIRKFNASSSQDIGVNTELQDVLKILKEMELKANTPHQASASSSGLIDELKRETQKVTNELLVDCQKADEEIDSLLQSNKQLLNVFSKAEKVLKNSILTNIYEMVTQNVSRVTYLKKHSQNLESLKMVINEKRNKIKKAKMKAESAETFTKAGVVADEVGCMKTDLQKTLGNFMGQVSEEEKMQLKLKKVAETTNEKIVLLGKIVTSAGKDDSVSFVPDIKKMAIQESVLQNITIDSLLSRAGPVLDLIWQGKIFAYMEFEGSMRYAQLSLDENNRMCLHCLREQILPPNAQILQHLDVMNLIDASSRTSFLNFGTDEKSLGRTYVSSKTRDGLRILETGLEPLDWEEDFLPDLQSLSAKEDVPQEITIETLRERTSAVLDKLRSGKVFVFQDLGGRRRYAQLSLTEDDRICLHCFQEQQLPSDVHLLKHLDVMNLIDASSRSSFLTFGTYGKSLGRIYISLTPNTKRSQNFSALCTGEMGPSYLNSQINEVRFKGHFGERIVCGDYDGIGGKTLISGAGREKGGKLQKPWLAGSVLNCCGDDNQAAQFQIIMRDYPSCIYDTIFGKVESNLHILSEAISLYSNISDVQITDCGIVIPI